MKKKLHTYKKLNYVIATPDDFDNGKKYPTVIFLHGSGTRGSDPTILLDHGYFDQTGALGYDAVFVAPQCNSDSWFDIHEQLIDFAEFIASSSFSDPDRIYLMGASMGGYATWQLAISRPDLFAAIVPICGGGTYWNACRLCGMGVWAVHGAKDDAVFPEESVKMVDAINAAGGKARLTMLENVGHGSWDFAYSSREIHDWMFSHRRDHGNSFEDADSMYNDPTVYG